MTQQYVPISLDACPTCARNHQARAFNQDYTNHVMSQNVRPYKVREVAEYLVIMENYSKIRE